MRGILGADVFINLLLVFIITTGLLLMNTNKAGKIGDIVKKEQNLLKIDLPKGSSKGLPGGKPGNMATLSAEKTGEGIQHFMDDKPVKFTDLTKILKSKRISSVRIRFDRQISYGHYISVLDLCKQAGIKDITNVYTTNK
ncbi:MAG: biopolymer transporter ExbD [Desulfobacterales bacterium]|nr:biopolymer transporter ExbD [Desulfobacterales bacterium]MBL7205267.1 biopolymer transporter ExbD [Desulfobacteraceae bacterium]